MKILVSACIMGHNCKYNGGNNHNQKVVDFLICESIDGSRIQSRRFRRLLEMYI